jgi:hypothetical protein
LRRTLAILIVLGAATGCHQAQRPPIVLTRTEVVTRTVPVPIVPPASAPSVAVLAAPRCAPRIGPPPAYPDRDEALRDAPSIYEQVQLLLAGRRMRMERERELADALRTCARAGR